MKKTCHKCNKTKSHQEFPKNRTRRDGHSSTCLECKREYNRKHYLNNKQYYVDKAYRSKERSRAVFQQFKSELKCKICGESHPAALQFHHDNPNEKDIEIATAVNRGWSMTKLMKEIKKCIVLCANCHAIWHWEQHHGKWLPGCDGCTLPSEGRG